MTLPSHHRNRDEKSAMLALANKIECAELRLRQLRREAQHALHLPSGRVVTSGTVRRVNTDRETQHSSRLNAFLAEAKAENAAKGPPGSPEVPPMPTKASQEGER
jgi:hypothetical protein